MSKTIKAQRTEERAALRKRTPRHKVRTAQYLDYLNGKRRHLPAEQVCAYCPTRNCALCTW